MMYWYTFSAKTTTLRSSGETSKHRNFLSDFECSAATHTVRSAGNKKHTSHISHVAAGKILCTNVHRRATRLFPWTAEARSTAIISQEDRHMMFRVFNGHGGSSKKRCCCCCCCFCCSRRIKPTRMWVGKAGGDTAVPGSHMYLVA